jgi:hypothetical protein
MPRPTWNIMTLVKILHALEEKGKEILSFNHVDKDVFLVATSDAGRNIQKHVAQYRYYNNQLIEIFLDPSAK